MQPIINKQWYFNQHTTPTQSMIRCTNKLTNFQVCAAFTFHTYICDYIKCIYNINISYLYLFIPSRYQSLSIVPVTKKY